MSQRGIAHPSDWIIVMRSDGDAVKTHFRQFQKPMKIAATSDRLALVPDATIWELHNIKMDRV